MAAGDTAAGGGNMLTRKVGPLPTWGWLAIVTGGGLLVYMVNKKKTATAAATPGAAPGQTSASNVPDYVFQNYNQIPPTTPAPAPPPTAAPAPATPPPPAPAQTSSPIVGETLASATGGSGPPNVVGMSLSQAIAAIQKSGWSITSVVSARNPYALASTSANASAPVISAVPHASGLKGQYAAKSVSLAVP